MKLKLNNWLYLERAHEGFIHTHHAACVIKLPAVVWSREECDQLAFGKKLISILHNLLEDTVFFTAWRNQYKQKTNHEPEPDPAVKVKCTNHLQLNQYPTHNAAGQCCRRYPLSHQ